MESPHEQTRLDPTRPAAPPVIPKHAAQVARIGGGTTPLANAPATPLANARTLPVRLAGSAPIPPRLRPVDCGEVFRFWAFR